MKFTKMHGTGNDYIYVNGFEEKLENPSEAAVKLSDRRFGIGSDGLILILPSDVADCRMEMFNADGSIGKMCGNGIRCVAKYVYDRGLVKKDVLRVETRSGVKTLQLRVEDGKVASVRVNMGQPELDPEKIPVLFSKDRMVDEEVYTPSGNVWRVTCVSMGNPHAVIFVDDVEGVNLPAIGPEMEKHAMFPERANIEFAQVTGPHEVQMRVWERGSGETLACGTGACACAVASVLTGKTDRDVTVHLRGGDLHVFWDPDTDDVYMEGPAAFVFDGTVEI
ncbi:diaminopimelate epimerase [Anaeromassilibacillus sp. 1001302B_160321_C8]|uniref:diaminopimelate epimerase n=1 Tax=Anaeromassilibacillus sp. 1001302B_160321_C8 TaxID=2787132 RepID=UPI001898B6F5|nr:diaminopimelate epimerase [Anaeromassilibacillus sp. 1001302B_160321_C8]